MRQYINEDNISTENSAAEATVEGVSVEENGLDTIGEDSLEMESLGFKETLAYKFDKQKQLFAEMNGKQKIKYIFQYYKWHIIIAVILVVSIWEIGKGAYQSTFPNLLDLAFINHDGKATMYDYTVDAYREYYNLDTKNHINVYCNLYKTLDDEDVMTTTSPMNEAMAYSTLLSTLDVMIGDEKALEIYISNTDTVAVDSVLPEDLYKKVEDKAVIKADPYKNKCEGEPYVVALDVSDTEFIKNCDLSYDKAYLLIPCSVPANDEAVVRFVNFIFDLQ